VTTFLVTFFRKAPSHRAHHRERSRAFVAGGRWIAARIAVTSPQQTCHDHLPSFTPRRASASATWARFRSICRCSDQVAAAELYAG